MPVSGLFYVKSEDKEKQFILNRCCHENKFDSIFLQNKLIRIVIPLEQYRCSD